MPDELDDLDALHDDTVADGPALGELTEQDRTRLNEFDGEVTPEAEVVMPENEDVFALEEEEEPESERYDMAADHMVETDQTSDTDPEVMALDRGQEASDLPRAAFSFGMTAGEEWRGEDLEEKLAAEEIDPVLQAGSSYDAISGPVEPLADLGDELVYGGDGPEGPSVLDVDPSVMAAYALDGQGDDATGGNAGDEAARAHRGGHEGQETPGESTLPHGPH